MDGRGRWLDNVFVERLWRSLKYEEVHLKAYADGREARVGISAWVTFYNTRRPHQALGNRTPTAVWRAEMFWDPNGAATGIHNNYFEMTAGIQYRPRDWLWFRPEIRYDTSFPNPAYNDQTVRNQLTLGFDVILLW